MKNYLLGLFAMLAAFVAAPAAANTYQFQLTGNATATFQLSGSPSGSFAASGGAAGGIFYNNVSVVFNNLTYNNVTVTFYENPEGGFSLYNNANSSFLLITESPYNNDQVYNSSTNQFIAGTYALDEYPENNTKDGPEYSLTISQISSSVPEPSTWAMMILGFGLAGYALRRDRREGVAALRRGLPVPV
jgi:hypothetical protein